MAFFDKLRDKALDLAEAGVSKAKEVGEIAKLNLAIASEEDGIRKAYTEIGRLYYAANEHSPEPAYAEIFNRIEEAREKIELNKAKIVDLKAAGAQESDSFYSPSEASASVSDDVPPEEPIDPQI